METLEEIHQQIVADYRDRLKTLVSMQTWYPAFQKAVSDLDVTIFVCYSPTIALTGNRAALNRVFGALRRAGFEPDERPAEDQPTFSTFFRDQNGEPRAFLDFSSTVCKVKQVGTTMKEVPIYETICEDELSNPDELAPPEGSTQPPAGTPDSPGLQEPPQGTAQAGGPLPPRSSLSNLLTD